MFKSTDAKGSVSERYRPKLLGDDKAEVYVYGEIGWHLDANTFIAQLREIGNVSELHVRINSPGGFASDAVAMYQALSRVQAKRVVFIDAAAYSAATIVAMAASPGELRMAFNARMMVHNAWNYAQGDKREMRKVGDILESLDVTIAKTYAKRMSGHSEQQILELMDEESWYTAEEAKEVGLVDKIFDGDEEANGLDADAFASVLKRFKNVPRDLADRARAHEEHAPPEAGWYRNSAIAWDVRARMAELGQRAA